MDFRAPVVRYLTFVTPAAFAGKSQPSPRYRVFFFLVAIALACFLAPPIRADPTSALGETAEGVFGEGSTAQGGPDNKTGAMIYSYPLDLPTARGRPQPRLSLNYSSFSHDREAGYGWGLDLPVIERTPLSGNPCFAQDGTPIACGEQRLDATRTRLLSEERYTFNGQPLVFICRLPGTQGINDPDCGNEIQPTWASEAGWRYFRLQAEGQFSRFYLSPDRKYWRAQLKGGELLEFGEPPDRGVSGIEHAFNNKKAFLRWRLVRHSDAVHTVAGTPVNYIDYRWKRLGKRGLLYLTDIYDTPRANGPNGDDDFAHHTQLTWQSPDFPQTFYADPHRATPDLRLSRVAVASMPWSGSKPREIIRTYLLGYKPAQGATSTVALSQVFQLWHHSFLAQIWMEGRCNQFEDDQGNIPTDRECSTRTTVPPTRFEYEDGNPAFGLASVIIDVQGGPPDTVEQDRVLPYLNKVGVVDFNRDGLPDIVQGWKQGLSCGGTTVSNPDPDVLACQNARPMIGYLNRGLDVLKINLDYQCFDAGRSDDTTGLTHYALGTQDGFFANTGGATLIGAWGEGVLAWSNAQYSPYRAHPLLPTANPGDFAPGSGCDIENFSVANFNPGWKWEKTQNSIDWAKPASTDSLPQPNPPGGHGPFAHSPLWFTDIDGDGLVDRLADTGVRAGDFNVADVEFTRRYGKNDPRPGSGSGPAQVPFAFDPSAFTGRSLAPSVQARADTKFYYVDINGDGLVDLVTYNPIDGGGVPRVRPGNGYGEFTCIDSQQPWPCQELPTEVARIYEINVLGSRMPWPFNAETFFHDVTADGLADIVQYDMASGEVRLWVNQNGHTFACTTGSCIAGKVLNAHAETHGLTGSAAWNIGDHRTTFADMNADGIDDIVILAKVGAYIGTFMKKYIGVYGFERGAAPKPGLLTRIHNGYGATTDIRYSTVQELDRAAAKDSATAWQFHSPIVESVVTQVVTQDSYHAGGDLNDPLISDPYSFKRKAQYLYQNPAYDRWSRSFAGFRKVIAHYGDEAATTVTTYWFGPCQNNGLNARLPGSPDIPLCPGGSDDDDYKSLTGRVVRIDRGNEFLSVFPVDRSALTERAEHLWTKTFNYRSATLFDRADRRVTFSYPGQIDTYLYDDAQPTQPGGQISPSIAGADPFQGAAHQNGIRKHLTRLFQYDDRGNLQRVTDRGAVKDGDSKPSDVADVTTITLFSPQDAFDPDGPGSSEDTSAVLPCSSDWQCLPVYVSIWEPQSTVLGNNPDKLLRKSRYRYSASGDVQSVEGWLDAPAQALERHHPSGNNSIAPQPAGQSINRGWHTLATLSYDAWGNVTQTMSGQSAGGSPASCTATGYDDAYQHLPRVVRRFTNGCAGSALSTNVVFDRGFGQVVASTAPDGGSSELRYDQFGRPLEVYLPNPDAVSGAQTSVLAATIAYADRKPLSYIDVRHSVGPATSTRSVTILNGLLEPVAAFDQGDNNDWVLNGWATRTSTGQIQSIRHPWKYTGDPIATAVNAKFIPVPTDNTAFETYYDGFGRQVSSHEAGAGFSLELMHTRYFPLAIETRDAEQLKAGGQHAKAFSRVEFDGRGRRVKSLAHVANPVGDDIVTAFKYAPTGEPVTVTRTHAGGTYTRTMLFDTLGRLMANKEPNTGNNWRYVWDDAGRLVGTSDARGCGENLYYDGLNRLIGEDYSPCLASQPAYTAADLATGAGLEAFFRYDAYEADQIRPEPGFSDDSRLALGHLVAVSDRGSHTRFNYDARGRVRRVSRQIARPPGLVAGTGYAPHWFASRLDYDLGDRLTRRTTGVDVQELLMNGGSEARYAYTPRSQLAAIDSSYGAVIKSMDYDPEGAPSRIVYGDARSATARFVYDSRHRLTLYQLIALPSAGLPTPIGYFDYRFSAYDEVANPLMIEDVRIAWQPLPAAASPLEKRAMQYDDLYRLTRVDNTYKLRDGIAPWQSPFDHELNTGDRHPVALREMPTRIKQQTYDYDGLGNLTASLDDLAARYDRSLGPDLGYGTPQDGPNQLRSGEGLQVRYDPTGNVKEIRLERTGNCPTGVASQCAQWFAYDWDEVGQLARARRWDFDGNALPTQAAPAALPAVQPSWDVSYAYSQGTRVRKSVNGAAGQAGDTRHTLEVFDTLRVERAEFDAQNENYRVRRENVHAYPAGMAHVFWDTGGQLPHQTPGSLLTMHLVIGDHLGSSSVVLNHATSELVERTTYQPYGAIESDYRPAKWQGFREPYKFTGKEEDIEVGVTYFGARYYQAYLGRFMSADPLTVHGLGSDLNPYAYVAGRVVTQVDPLGLGGCDPPIVCMPEGQPEDVIFGRRPADERAAQAEAMASQATIRQPTSFQRTNVPPTRQSLADRTPVFPFFFPIPSEYVRPYQPAPQGAPPGFDAIRQLNGQTGVGVANFSRDKYPGTDVRTLTFIAVSALSSVASDVAQIGAVVAQPATRALTFSEPAAGVNQIENTVSAIETWLGEGATARRPPVGGSDLILRSADGTRQIRFDISNPHGLQPHINVETFRALNRYPGDTRMIQTGNQHIFIR